MLPTNPAPTDAIVESKAPVTIAELIQYNLFDASNEIGALGRELKELGHLEPTVLRHIIRKLAALASAAEIALHATPNSADDSMARDVIRNPHRMVGTGIL